MYLNIDYVESLAKRFLPLDTWGFVESARTESFLIYNSEWCRLRFYIGVDWHHQSATEYLLISYGRLHAIDNKAVMKWKGEDCHCWHDGRNLRILLQYLDGLTPEEAYKTERSREPLQLFKDFESSTLISNPKINYYEIPYMRQSMIWEHYGLRFFELFDLRHPELWDDCLDLLKEYDRLYYEELDAALAHRGQQRIPRDDIIPPSYKRC